ncbi:MAG: YhdP family protein, partial [Pseudomonas helleri]
LAHDVMVGEGTSALRLDNVKVVPDVWASLLNRDVRLASVQLGGLQLSARQDKDGHWALEGLPVQDDQPLDPEQLLNQLQRVARVSVLDSQVTLEPFNHAPMTLTYIGLTLDVGASDQRLDARLTLPDGQPLALSLKTQVQASRWRDGAAQAYLSLPQSDWAKWLPASLIQPWKVSELKAGGEFWFNWGNGTVQSAVARLNAPKLSGAYADRKAEILDNLALHAWVERGKQGFTVTLDSLAMNIADKRWETRLQLQQFAATQGEQERWHLQADHLDLTPITPLMDSLAPVPEAVAKVIDQLSVTGTLRNVLADYRPNATDDQKISFAANLQQVGFNATHGAPAARNVSGLISGDLGKGELRLDSKDFVLHLDPIFDKPWQYLQANALLKWTLDKNSFTLIAPYIKVLGEEGKIAADFLIRIHMDHSQEDYMDLRVGLTDGDGRFTPKYLPAVLSPALSEWLSTAILKGSVEEGFFQYQGSLDHDAVDAARNISLFFKVHGAELAFQPGWPHVRDVSGDVFIEDSGVRIMASKGLLLDTKVRNVAVNIPHVHAGKVSHLFLDGDFDGGLGDGLKILQEAPIGTESTFAGWQGEGSLKGRVDLDIPLEHGEEPKVVVDFNTDKARLKISDPELELTQLKGDFRFDSAKGLSGKAISGRAFDQPIKAQIFAEGKSGKLSTRVVASGQVGVKKLTDWLKFNQPIPVSGMLPYQLQLTLDDADSQLRVSSSLKGATIDLPAPFGLAANESRDSVFRMTLQGAERRYWFDYGDLANLTFAAPNGKFEDGRGELFLGYGDPVLPVTKGLRIRGVLSELDVAPWQALAERYAGKDPGGSAKQLLSSADFKVNKLIAFGTQLDQVRLQMKRSGAAWDLNINSKQATGAVTLPDAKNAPIKVTMQTIRLPAPDPKAVSDPNAPDPLASIDPRKIPALDIIIRQLYQGADLLGAWSLNIRPTTRGINLNNLSLGLKGLLLEGSGGWEGVAGASNSWYRGRIGGGNLANVLQGWGFAPSVTS